MPEPLTRPGHPPRSALLLDGRAKHLGGCSTVRDTRLVVRALRAARGSFAPLRAGQVDCFSTMGRYSQCLTGVAVVTRVAVGVYDSIRYSGMSRTGVILRSATAMTCE